MTVVITRTSVPVSMCLCVWMSRIMHCMNGVESDDLLLPFQLHGYSLISILGLWVFFYNYYSFISNEYKNSLFLLTGLRSPGFILKTPVCLVTNCKWDVNKRIIRIGTTNWGIPNVYFPSFVTDGTRMDRHILFI